MKNTVNHSNLKLGQDGDFVEHPGSEIWTEEEEDVVYMARSIFGSNETSENKIQQLVELSDQLDDKFSPNHIKEMRERISNIIKLIQKIEADVAGGSVDQKCLMTSRYLAGVSNEEAEVNKEDPDLN